MPYTARLCRPRKASAEVIGGENCLLIEDEAGVRVTIQFDSHSAADYAAAGIRGGMKVDEEPAQE